MVVGATLVAVGVVAVVAAVVAAGMRLVVARIEGFAEIGVVAAEC